MDFKKYVEKRLGREIEEMKLLAVGHFNRYELDCVVFPPENTEEETVAAMVFMAAAVQDRSPVMKLLAGTSPIHVFHTGRELVSCIEDGIGVFVGVQKGGDDD